MGWSLGWDNNWKRDIGYGVPAWCDHPKCNAEIDRGLAFVCGGRPYGGDLGCGLYFCEKHRADHRWSESDNDWVQVCPRCLRSKPPYKRIKADHTRWIVHKLTDESWKEWRAENATEVTAMQLILLERGVLIDVPDDVPDIDESHVARPEHRECRDEWLRAIRDACRDTGTAFFLKQLGGWPDARAHEKALLDGRTWTEMPNAL